MFILSFSWALYFSTAAGSGLKLAQVPPPAPVSVVVVLVSELFLADPELLAPDLVRQLQESLIEVSLAVELSGIVAEPTLGPPVPSFVRSIAPSDRRAISLDISIVVLAYPIGSLPSLAGA